MGVTRYPNGITNVDQNQPLGDFGMLDPSLWAVYFNDFIKPTDYAVSDWTITTTELGAGSATEAIANTGLGSLVLTNAAGDNDLDSLQLAKETFKFVAGKKAFFKARLQVSDATQSDFMVGLVITDTTPLTNTDGVYFQKDDGDASIDFHVNKNSTATSSVGVGTAVDATAIELAFAYDGNSEIAVYIDGVRKVTSVTTNLPDDEDLTVTLHIQNGAAAAKSMTVDYLLVAVER